MRPSLLTLILAVATTTLVYGQTTPPAKDGKAEAPKEVTLDPASQLPPPDTSAPDPAPDKLKKIEKKNDAGVVVLSYTAYTDDKGREIKHGSYIEFFDSGMKRREMTYRHDSPNGFQRWWHSNGQVWMEFNTKLGVRDGNYVEYTRSGQVKKRLVYKDGKFAMPDKP